jgi:hypothetical protein
MALTDQETAVLAAFVTPIISAAGVLGIDPVVYAAEYGAGGCALVNAGGLEAKAAAIRQAARTALADAEARAQALEAQAAALRANPIGNANANAVGTPAPAQAPA